MLVIADIGKALGNFKVRSVEPLSNNRTSSKSFSALKPLKDNVLNFYQHGGGCRDCVHHKKGRLKKGSCILTDIPLQYVLLFQTA